MNRFERWFIRRAVSHHLRGGYVAGYHTKSLTELYDLVHEAVDNEFTEDNFPTRRAICQDCFETSLEQMSPAVLKLMKGY